MRMLQADNPVTLIETAIAQVYAALRRTRARRWLRGAARVEWWAHSRRGAEPHQLHFDLNESLLRKGRSAYALQHPVRSALCAQLSSPTICSATCAAPSPT